MLLRVRWREIASQLETQLLRPTGTAKNLEQKKRKKYTETAAQHHAELLPLSVETFGGMAPDAIKLLAAMGSVGNKQLGMCRLCQLSLCHDCRSSVSPSLLLRRSSEAGMQ